MTLLCDHTASPSPELGMQLDEPMHSGHSLVCCSGKQPGRHGVARERCLRRILTPAKSRAPRSFGYFLTEHCHSALMGCNASSAHAPHIIIAGAPASGKGTQVRLGCCRR